MSVLQPLNELVGLLVAIVLALGLVSLLLHIKGADAGLPRRQVRRTILAVWGAVLVGTAALLALRYSIGTPLFSGSWAEGSSVRATSLPPLRWAEVGLALVVLSGCLLWALRAVRSLSAAGPPAPEPPAHPDMDAEH